MRNSSLVVPVCREPPFGARRCGRVSELAVERFSRNDSKEKRNSTVTGIGYERIRRGGIDPAMRVVPRNSASLAAQEAHFFRINVRGES